MRDARAKNREILIKPEETEHAERSHSFSDCLSAPGTCTLGDSVAKYTCRRGPEAMARRGTGKDGRKEGKGGEGLPAGLK